MEGLKKRVSVAAIRALAILGEHEEVGRAVGRPGHNGRGIRILAMDGGGMKVRSLTLETDFLKSSPLPGRTVEMHTLQWGEITHLSSASIVGGTGCPA